MIDAGIRSRPGLLVEPAAQLEHPRLRHVLDRREAAGRVAVQGRVADGGLRLVATSSAPGGRAGSRASSGSRRGCGPARSRPRGRSASGTASANARRAASSIGSSRKPTPRRSATRRASERVSGDVEARRHRDACRPGPAPSASAASAATSAESMPPERPSSTRGKPFLVHVVAQPEAQRRPQLGLAREAGCGAMRGSSGAVAARARIERHARLERPRWRPRRSRVSRRRAATAAPGSTSQTSSSSVERRRPGQRPRRRVDHARPRRRRRARPGRRRGCSRR